MGMLHTGGQETTRIRSRGRTLRITIGGLGAVAVMVGGCAAQPDTDTVVEGGGPPIALTESTTTAPTTPTTTVAEPATTTTAPAPTTTTAAPGGGFTSAATSASMGGCALYPPDHYMNAIQVDTLPVDPRSQTWLEDLGAGSAAPLRFPTSRIWDGARGGVPLNVVDSDQIGFTDVTLSPDYVSRAYTGPYPIPPDPKVQGYPSAQWDKHLLIVDTADCQAYELIQYDPFVAALTGHHTAMSGVRYPLDTTAMPRITTNSPNTPMIGQYVRQAEVDAGEVPHVMAFCSNRIGTGHRWPARSSDGALDGSGAMPMGAWVRLKSSVESASFSTAARAVVDALKERGAVLTDTCSHSFSLLAENSADWNDAVMQQLTALDTSDFEVVDATPMRADSTSYRIR